MNPILYIVGTILTMSMLGNGIQVIKIKGLNNDKQELEQDLTECRMNKVTLVGAIETQNKAIDLQKIDLIIKDAEIAKWKAKPAEIRYNTIYKEIPEYIDLRKEDCETTKAVIDAARNINFN